MTRSEDASEFDYSAMGLDASYAMDNGVNLTLGYYTIDNGVDGAEMDLTSLGATMKLMTD